MPFSSIVFEPQEKKAYWPQHGGHRVRSYNTDFRLWCHRHDPAGEPTTSVSAGTQIQAKSDTFSSSMSYECVRKMACITQSINRDSKHELMKQKNIKFVSSHTISKR